MDTYLSNVRKAIDNKDGSSMANLLSLTTLSQDIPTLPCLAAYAKTPLAKYKNPHIATIYQDLLQRKGQIDIKFSKKYKPYDDVVQNYISIIQEGGKGADCDVLGMYKYQASLVQAFLRSFSSADDNWELPVLKIVTLNIRIIALLADDYLRRNDRVPAKLADAARVLSKGFSITMTDRLPLHSSKKWGALFVIITIFKIYFKLNNLRLCNNIILALENPKLIFPKLEHFPKSEVVTYRYLRGRLHVNSGKFKEAEAALEYAFNHCHPSSRKNKRIILIHLVVIKMMHGLMPQKEVLVKYNLEQEFYNLSLAVKSGNLALFNVAFAQNQTFYMKYEIYLTVRIKLKNIMYRNLSKKVNLLLSKGSEPNTRLPLKLVHRAYEILQNTISLDEIECIMANLIFNGFVRGYISHEHRTVVLSKKQAFPPPHTFL